MEVKELYPFAMTIILVGLLLGIGLLTLDSFSKQVRTTTTIQDDAVNLSTNATSLSQTYCIGITSATFANGTAVSAATLATITIADDDTCYITSSVGDYAVLYNVTYTYGASSVTQTTTDYMTTAISPISSTWMALIVTVAVLAIILGLVIGSFGGQRK